MPAAMRLISQYREFAEISVVREQHTIPLVRPAQNLGIGSCGQTAIGAPQHLDALLAQPVGNLDTHVLVRQKGTVVKLQ
jgi:hypothetical protein